VTNFFFDAKGKFGAYSRRFCENIMDLLDAENVRRIISNILYLLVPSGKWSERYLPSDKHWLTVPEKVIVEIANSEPKLDQRLYIQEIFDCDDFALAFKSRSAGYAVSHKLTNPLAVGFIFTEEHVWNFFIDESWDMVLLDLSAEIRQLHKCPPGKNKTQFFQEKLRLSENPSNEITLIYI